MRFLDIIVPVLTVFLLGNSFCYGNEAAEEIYHRGMKHALKGEFKEAGKAFKGALEIDPSYPPARMCKLITNDAINNQIKKDVALLNFHGTEYANKDNLDDALKEFTKATAINPRYHITYLNRGLVYFKKDQISEAISDFNKAIEIEPKFPTAYLNRGMASAADGEYDQAISGFNKAIELDPRFGMAYNNRGMAYAKKGHYDRAVSDFNKALEVSAGSAIALAYYNRGLVHTKRGQQRRAISDYSKAIALNPNSLWPTTIGPFPIILKENMTRLSMMFIKFKVWVIRYILGFSRLFVRL